MAAAMADVILVNVNPAFQANELEYCLNKVGVKVLFTDSRFKASDYIKILQELIPDLDKQNPLNLKSSRLPDLKKIVLISEEEQVKGMLNYFDLYKLNDP